jgi:hypothetical protein
MAPVRALGYLGVASPKAGEWLEFGPDESDHITHPVDLRSYHCNPRPHSLALAGIPGLRLGASSTVARYDRTSFWGHEPGGLPPGAVEPVNEEAPT